MYFYDFENPDAEGSSGPRDYYQYMQEYLNNEYFMKRREMVQSIFGKEYEYQNDLGEMVNFKVADATELLKLSLDQLKAIRLDEIGDLNDLFKTLYPLQAVKFDATTVEGLKFFLDLAKRDKLIGYSRFFGLIHELRSDLDNLSHNISLDEGLAEASSFSRLQDLINEKLQIQKAEVFNRDKNLHLLKTFFKGVKSYIQRSWKVFFHKSLPHMLSDDSYQNIEILCDRVINAIESPLFVWGDMSTPYKDLVKVFKCKHILNQMQQFMQSSYPGEMSLNFSEMYSSDPENFIVSFMTSLDSNALIDDIVDLQYYEGLEDLVVQPDVFLGIEKPQMELVNDILLQCMGFSPSIMKRFGENLEVDDFFPGAIKGRNYYMRDKKVITARRGGTEFETIAPIAFVDRIFESYQKAKEKAETFLNQTLNLNHDKLIRDFDGLPQDYKLGVYNNDFESFASDQLKLGEVLKTQMIKTSFMASMYEFLSEHSALEKRFLRRFKSQSSTHKVPESNIQNLIRVYKEAYSGIDAQNMDQIYTTALQELPFLIAGFGVGSLVRRGALTIFRTLSAGSKVTGAALGYGFRGLRATLNFVTPDKIQLYLKGLSTAKLNRLRALFETLKGTTFGGKAVATTAMAGRGSSLVASGLQSLFSGSVNMGMDALELISSIYFTDLIKVNMRAIDRGEFSLDFLMESTLSLKDNLLQNFNRNDLAVALMMPQVLKLSSKVMGLSGAYASRLTVNNQILKRASGIMSRKFITMINERLLAASVHTMTYEMAVDIVNELTGAGLSKEQVLTHLLNLCESSRHSGLVKESELKNLSMLVSVI